MRQNLDSYKALADKAEEDKMDLAYELKVVGTKRRLPLSPFSFPSFWLFMMGCIQVGPSPPLFPPLLFFVRQPRKNRRTRCCPESLSLADFEAAIQNHSPGTPAAEGDFGVEEQT